MSALKLVMFDLDGTLVETAPEIADAVNDTLVHHGLSAVSQQQVNDWIGHGTHTLLVSALAFARNQSTQEIRQWHELPAISTTFSGFYQQRCGTRSTLYPQVREVLAQLAAHRVHLAVVTNKEGRYTQTVLQAHRLEDTFDLVVSGDTLPTKKPDPAGIAHCLKHLCVSAGEALFVGDSSIDAATARNAGVPVWLLPYGYNMGASVHDALPDRVIPNFIELLTLLETS